MKPIYMDPAIRSIADLTLAFSERNLWELHRINVPLQSRGLGHGSKLLRRVLEDADREGATIALNVYPSGPLDEVQLEAWYRRHGFVTAKEIPWQLVRHPQPEGNTNGHH